MDLSRGLGDVYKRQLFGLNEWLKGKVLRGEIEAVNGVYPVVFLHTGGTLNVRQRTV
jgi:hypothetical protein